MRQAANDLHQMFTALVGAGFSEHQALVILGNMLAPKSPS